MKMRMNRAPVGAGLSDGLGAGSGARRGGWVAMMAGLAGGTLSLWSAQGQATFTGLGTLSGFTKSAALGVSGDGKVVVGNVEGAGGILATRWVLGPSIFGNTISGNSPSYCYAASGDGSVCAGGEVNGGDQAFRWTSEGSVDLPFPQDYIGAQASAISSDGSIIGGTLDIDGIDPSFEAFRWDGANGIVPLGFLSNGSESHITRVSADGGTMVGYGNNAVIGAMALRWTSGSGLVGMNTLGGGTFSLAKGVSGDGSVIVGQSGSSSGPRAFRWTLANGMQSLGVLGGGTSSGATAISDDGLTIVGQGNSSAGSTRTFIWTQADGMRDLETLLGAAVPAGWVLLNPTGVSSNGKVIVGAGLHNAVQEAWVVNLAPAAPACYANCDGSTGSPALTAGDFVCFLTKFRAGDAYANCDGSTGSPALTAGDFVCFLSKFRAGCP